MGERATGVGDAAIPWRELEDLLARDPARRGLGAWQERHGRLFPGALEESVRSLLGATGVAIVTGFYVADAETPAAETDGPPGALYLARALAALDIPVWLVSDPLARPLLECGAARIGLPQAATLEFPFEVELAQRGTHAAGTFAATDAWIAQFHQGPGRQLSHLVAVERVGPSHTSASLAANDPRNAKLFAAEVPPTSHDRCHNMRGLDITASTAKTHRWFEHVAAERPEVVTIGIGDGGNELGLGSLPWGTLRSAVPASGAKIACRIATRHTLLAGVSNWAGYALAAGVCALAGNVATLAPWDCADEEAAIERLVREAGAIDGATRRREATVDGLPLITYLQTLAGVRRLLGLAE